MPKKFQIKGNRYVVLEKDQIKMFENGTNKNAIFTYPRNKFVENVDVIDACVTKMAQHEQDVKLQQHIGVT